MGKRTKRPERLELRLSANEKQLIVACANATGQSCNEFVLAATVKQMKKLKITLKRPQAELFKPKPGDQMDIF